MRDSYYSSPIKDFLCAPQDKILGELTRAHHHALEHQQRNAWLAQIEILKEQLREVRDGQIFFEFAIPRMGKRADTVLLYRGMLFVVEFKVGSETFDQYAVDQVHDYALDLKNFHLGSHGVPIIPVLCASSAQASTIQHFNFAKDGVATPVQIGIAGISEVLVRAAALSPAQASIDVAAWRSSGYRPTPTIIEAAEALYRDHAVDEISRSDAGAKNLRSTSDKIAEIIERSKRSGNKSICFITGVPGAGKTLAGLNFAAKRAERYENEHAVFLSGNGPLVDVLREALARDQVGREGIKKSDAHRAVRRFVQNIHHFRDHYVESEEVPFEKVVVFDEAQRAWTKDQASKFMQAKRGHSGFSMSEPEFLIGVMDRNPDWCTIICLIGGGQEINTGEAGLAEWLTALRDRFVNWEIHASTLLEDHNYAVDDEAASLIQAPGIKKHSDLHLSVSMRSFRAEQLSAFVAQLLDGAAREASETLSKLIDRYPIAITRDVDAARSWLLKKARGTERYGLIASSGAYRLRPEGIQVKAKIDPPSWFLNNRSDVRSSYYMEEVATQFDIQGLELDWTGVCWDADLRWIDNEWQFHAFKGTRWQNIKDDTRRLYLLNAYRVLLTRSRQGMVIFVPSGNNDDHTRPTKFYDGTFEFLRDCGVPEIHECQ